MEESLLKTYLERVSREPELRRKLDEYMAGKLADPAALVRELQTIPDEDLAQVSAGAAPAKSTDAVRDLGRLSNPNVLDAMVRLLGMR